MEAVKRCLYRSVNGRRLFYPATWSSLCHTYAKSNSTLVTNTCQISAGIGKRCASALLDTKRGMASKNTNTADRLVWLDMEMTGLDVENCHIMEIACLITDSELEVVSDNFNLVVHQPDEVLATMNDWCVEQHGKTGLTEACRSSKISLSEAEQLTLKFLSDHVPEKKCAIAGNTVWMDRIFLKKYMPLVDDYAHYRIVDVSGIKELVRRWCPQLYSNAPTKQLNHRALDDIKESIMELKYYKSKIFNP